MCFRKSLKHISNGLRRVFSCPACGWDSSIPTPVTTDNRQEPTDICQEPGTFIFYIQRATLETCYLWDIWSQWWGNILKILTFFDKFVKFSTILTVLYNFWQFWQFLTILTISDTTTELIRHLRSLSHDNHSDLTIKGDTGHWTAFAILAMFEDKRAMNSRG